MSTPRLGVELYVDGAWADISDDVHADGVSVTRGRSDEATSTEPARMSLRLRNNDGKYSPRNARSTLFGKIGRNTPVRAWVEMGGPRLVQDAGGQWTCPDAAPLDITGDIDVRVDVAMRTWRPAADGWLGVLKNGAIGLRLLTNGAVQLLWNSPTQKTLTSTTPVPKGITGRKAIRATLDVDNTFGGHVARFYYAPTLAGPWVQFGGAVAGAGTTAIVASTGTLTTWTTDPGEVFGVEVRAGIGGPVVAALDPTAQAPGVTSVADGYGNTWTPLDATRAQITDRHYLFVGEVVSWPQRWGAKGAPSAYSPIECASILRRLGQGTSPVKSTLRRGIEAQTTLAGYWPLEEGRDATSHVAVVGLPGRQIGTVTPAAYDGFAASDPIVKLGQGRLYLPVRPYQPTGQVQVRFLLHIDQAPADDTVLASIGCSSSLGRIDLLFDATTGGYYAQLYSNLGVLGHTTPTLNSNLVGRDMRLSVEVAQDGADVDIRIVTQVEGEIGGLYADSTKTGMTLGAVTYVDFNPTRVDLSASVGHVSVEKAITDLFGLSEQYRAYAGERADTRLLRLASENGLSLAAIGAGAGCERMGPQQSAELVALLGECEQADQGLLFEARADTALRYRTLESLWGQAPAISMPFGDGSMFDMEPVDDDQGTRNVVTVTRRSGGEATVRQATGPLGTAPPPAGVGIYDESVTVNLATDAATVHHAGWRLNLGTVDEARWPVISLDLAHPDLQADPDLTRRLLGVDIGDLVEITDLPSWLPPFPVRQLVLGSTVTVAATGKTRNPWTARLSWNCVPASPYRVGTWVQSGYYDETAPTTIFTEDFTGTDGAALAGARWTTGFTGSAGASATIQGNKGRWLTGTGTGYSFATKGISRALVIADRADSDVSGTYTPQGECYPLVYLRAADSVFDGNSGYALLLPTQGGSGSLAVLENSTPYSGNQIGTATFAATNGVTYGFRFRALSDQIKAKVWDASAPEPSAWNIEVTNSAITTAGDSGIAVGPGNAASAYVDFDDITLTNGVGAGFTPYSSADDETRWGPGASALAAGVDPDDTTLSVATTVGPLWTTDADDFPLDVTVGGEVLTVTDVTGSSSPQAFTVVRAVNGVEKAHASGAAVTLAAPSRWGARPIGGTGFGTGDTGGGTTGGGTVQPNTVKIGTATFPLAGVNPTYTGGWGGDAAYPGGRGVNQLVAYTQPTVATTGTNQWGAEVPADADYLVNSVNDRQASGSTSGTAVPSPLGIVLSGHGTARDWLLANATPGALIELVYVAPTTGGGGGTGGGGTGGGTTSPYPAAMVTTYKLVYDSSSPITVVPTTVGEIRLAFAFGASGPYLLGVTNPGLTTAGQAAALATLAARRAAGIRIVVSIGGAGNNVVTTNRSTFLAGIAQIRSLLTTAGGGGLDGLDWDIEIGGAFPTADAVYISTQLKALYGAGFAITTAPNGNNVGAYLTAAVQLHQANALDNYGQQFYDYQNPSYGDVAGRISEAISRGIPASKLSVGMALTSPVANGFWSQAAALSALQQVRAQYGVRKAYLWAEDSLYTNGSVATWVNNAKTALGA